MPKYGFYWQLKYPILHMKCVKIFVLQLPMASPSANLQQNRIEIYFASTQLDTLASPAVTHAQRQTRQPESSTSNMQAALRASCSAVSGVSATSCRVHLEQAGARHT
jgi:hypothetical protein